MKGIIQIAVQIDYDEMIKEEDMISLAKFTGKDSLEEIASHHAMGVASKIENELKGLPHVVYRIDATMDDSDYSDDTSESTKDTKDETENSSEENYDVEQDDNSESESPLDELADADIDSGEQIDLHNMSDLLKQDIRYIKDDLGSINHIDVSLEAFDGALSLLIDSQGYSEAYHGDIGGISTYGEAMEEIYVIHYTNLADGRDYCMSRDKHGNEKQFEGPATDVFDFQ